MTDRMDEDSIFCGVESDDPDQLEFIEDEKELCQILHNAFTYKKEYCLHAVGNTKSLLSCTKKQFVQELCEAYQKTLAFLHNRCLQPFTFTRAPAQGKI